MSPLDVLALIGGCLGWVTFGWLLLDRRRPRVTRIDSTEVPLRNLRPMRSALVLDDGRRLLVTRVEYRRHADGHGVTIEAADEQHLMRQHGIVVDGPGS